MDNAPMIFIRGASGAGKSTFAANIRGKDGNAFIFETDRFFMDLVNGHDYHFDSNFLGIAHSWNQGEVIRACRDCPTVPVIVANTFCHNWELKPYLEIARAFKRPVFVFTLRTEHDNVHNVPEKTVRNHRLGLQDFDMDRWVREGYPVAYSLTIANDKQAAQVAQMIHTKLFEKN